MPELKLSVVIRFYYSQSILPCISFVRRAEMAVNLNGCDTAVFTFLNRISQELEHRNLKDMIFLLYDSGLPRSQLEKVQCGNDLFELLINARMMSWQLLDDFLALIKRKDLQDKVRSFSKHFKVPSVGGVSVCNESCIPTPLRRLMYQMAEDMCSKMVEDIKFCETSLSPNDKLEDALDILDYFIKIKPIHSIHQIPEMLKDIPHVLELYKKHYQESVQVLYKRYDTSNLHTLSSVFSGKHDAPTDLQIPEVLNDILCPIKLDQKQCLEFEEPDCSEVSIPCKSSDASSQYQARFKSLFSGEYVPTFETEYLHTEDLDFQEDKMTAGLGRGTFGVIDTAFYKKKEVAVKSFHDSENISMKDLRMIVYLRHPFLLSIMKAEFRPSLRLVYCIKPKQNLAKLLKDTERLQVVCRNSTKKLIEQKKRVKMLCQISDALSFLHTSVIHIRGPVVHMNVKPYNIFLDTFDNAFLGDVDTAVEIQDGATHRSVEGFEMEGYDDRYKEKGRKKPSDDVFSLGIVTLQVLKWQPSVTESPMKLELFDRVSELVHSALQQPITFVTEDRLKAVIVTKDFFDENIWTSGEEGTCQTIGHIAFQCLLMPESRITAAQYSAKLKEILERLHHKLWDSEEHDKRCIQCHFYDINDMLETTSDTCTKACTFHNRFCKDCHYYSFRSPLHCPSHGTVYSMIGNPKSFALLICGYDRDNWQYKAFQKDIDYVKRIITDPRIMNIRLENLLEVRKGGIENAETFEDRFSEMLSQKVEFLFVYYSGHGIRNGIIQVTENKQDIIEIKKLRELLGRIQCERLLVLFDCCFAADSSLLPCPMPETYKWITVLYSSDAENSAKCNTKEGSIFTRYFLAGLQSTQTCVCQEKNRHGINNNGRCLALENFREKSAKTGFIELHNLTEYICDHAHEPVNQKPKQHNLDLSSFDTWGKIIAYYNESPDPVAYNFRFIHPPSKVEIPIQLEQIDHSAPQLEQAVLKRLSQEIEKYAPIADVTSETNLQLKSEAGKEIITVNDFKKLAMRNECFMVYII